MVGVNRDIDITRDASLRPFCDHTFEFATFHETRFKTTDAHCISCWKRIAPPGKKEAENVGYVTIHEVNYKDLPPLVQYAWVCNDCFARYGNDYGWKVSKQRIPQIPAETEHVFAAAYRDYLKRIGSQEKDLIASEKPENEQE